MLSEQTILFIKEQATWLLPSILGVATMLAFKSSTEKITFVRVIRALIMGIFVGYAAEVLCAKYTIILLRGLIIAVSGVLSESLMQFLFKNDSKIFKSVIAKVFNINVDKGGDNVTNS